MDNMNFSLLWSKSYNGSRLAVLDIDSFCYVSDKNIIISGKWPPFHFPGTGISAFAVHQKEKLVAIADKCLDPIIYIYKFPLFVPLSELKGGGTLEFQALTFSSNDYLVSISGVPDYQLNLWQYADGLKLCTIALPRTDITSVSFNPDNWHNLCVTYMDIIHIYKIMKSNDYFEMEQKSIDCPSRHKAKEFKYQEKEQLQHPGLEIPIAAIACITGKEAEKLHQKLEDIPSVCPVSHTWQSETSILIGCHHGQILKIGEDTLEVVIIFNPEYENQQFTSDVMDPKIDLDTNWTDSIEFICFYQNNLFTAGKSGYLCMFDVSMDNAIKLITFYNTAMPITSMTFTFSYNKLLIGTSEGKIQTHDLDKLYKIQRLENETSSKFVDMQPIYPGIKVVASARENGLVQFWDIKSGEKLSVLDLQSQISSMACSPSSYLVTIGFSAGNIFVIDVTDVAVPRIIYNKQLCSYSIDYLHYDRQCLYLFALTNNKVLIILDASVTTRYKIYGFLEMPNSIMSVTTENSDGVKVFVSAAPEYLNREMGFNKIIFFYLEPDFKTTFEEKYQSSMCLFDNDKLYINILLLTSPVRGLEAMDGFIYTTLKDTQEIMQLVYKFDSGAEQGTDWELQNTYPYHQYSAHCICFSFDGKWLLSAGQDGSINAFLTDDLSQVQLQSITYDYHMKGLKTMTFSWDCQYLLTTGHDSTASCYKINYEHKYLAKTQSIISKEWHHQNINQKIGIVKRESKACMKIPNFEISSELPENKATPHTWLDVKRQLALEEKDREISEEKEKIKESIAKIRQTVQNMLKSNDSRPDIEKLEQYEFDLDVEEQVRLQVDGEAAIQKIYENTEYENLAKLYVKEKIKEECYDRMFVKGRSLKAFLIPLEVDNFPLMERSNEELEQLIRVENKRKIEKKVELFNIEIMELLSKATGSQSIDMLGSLESIQDEEDKTQTEYSSETQLEPEDSNIDIQEQSQQVAEAKAKVIESRVEEIPMSTAIEGSLGSSYGGASAYLYNQLELHSRDQKISQIILLQGIIYKIKETFNKDFNDLFARKEMEIAKIKEKNKRVSVIISDLGLNEDIYVPELTVAEKPELAFAVDDSEVTIEKYLTTEEIKAIEEAKRIEEERKKKERADNSHERAMQDMMGGVLEIRKEDELKKDIPVPVVGPDEEDWTEEEVKIIKEYERKVKELNEEREKYRKGLESELKKLRGSIQEIMVGFDELINALFQKHTQVLMAIYQEELKLNRIKMNLMVEDEFAIYEKQLLWERNCKRKEVETIIQCVQDSEKRIVDFRLKYEQLLLEDRQMDKSFRNEFLGVSVIFLDILYKQFRKRPRAYKFKTPDIMPSGDVVMQNIYYHRKIVAAQLGNISLASALQEIDSDYNRPEGLDQNTWEKLCQIRKVKIMKEDQIMRNVLTFAEMGDFHQYKLEQLEKAHAEMDDIEMILKKLKRDKQQFHIDIDIQLLIKQGQVELKNDALIHDYQGAVLIHRSIIEELNTKIKELGEQKIASMVESKNFRKQIFHKEWEHRKMMMMMEDLKQKMSIVKFMKVTREVQKYLEEENYSVYNTQQTDHLEKLLVGVQNIHERKYSKIEDDISKLQMNIKMKKKENERLAKQIKIINVQVNDRRHIANVCQETPSTYGRVKYMNICHRKKLINRAKKQAAELTTLRKEVERLRRKTFPALI